MDKLTTGKLPAVLRHLNLGELSDIMGQEVLTGLSEIGLSLTKNKLIEILLSSRGCSFLGDKKNRRILFRNSEILSHLGLTMQCAEELINQSWLKNHKRVAELLNINSALLVPLEQKRLSHFDADGMRNLMPYQNWMRKKVYDFFSNKRSARALVHMPTGAGKTSTAMQIIFDQIRMRSPQDTTIIWLAHSDELCEQAAQSFGELWPNQQIGTARVWRAWGGFSDLNDYNADGCNFIVTSFQTLYGWMKSKKNDRFSVVNKLKMNADFLIIDEAHLSTATTYRSVIDYVSGMDTSILGLTATPGRHGISGDTIHTSDLVTFYDSNLLTMPRDDGTETSDPIGFLQSKGVLSQVELQSIPGLDISLSEADIKACSQQLEIPEAVLKTLGQDYKRTLNVARKALELAQLKNKQTLVFCPSKTNALILAEYLKINGCSAAAVTGDQPMLERQSNLEKFKSGEIKIITNYNVLTTGFDAPKISAVIIARPTLSVVLYSQMIGRGLRGSLFGGTASTTIVNVTDNIENLPDFKNAFTYFNGFFDKG
jgi:DNA repair protein RadD